ncbi:dTMP kinase [Aceticella autotrophica]|uniref:Thymidylate kinase n=1 Tax=Aceticella autotrophica TaxID=2755338 RepID=A0A975GA60_9THEO|nr:dTMP kinase [Aceticella autotrophica]
MLFKGGFTVNETKKFYGKGLANINADELIGKLIVIEGADGSGRSTQVEYLKLWLEREGYAVLNTGLKRSSILGDTIDEAKKGNVLGKTTLALLYATDFADQFENIIIPALKAGIIVLVDRYIFTLMARDIVRGAKREWVKEVFSFALVPDLIFYLQLEPEYLLGRAFKKRGQLDYWESGMDLDISRDMFESFHKYQGLLKKEFDTMAQEYNFKIIDAKQDIMSIQEILRKDIMEFLNNDKN